MTGKIERMVVPA